jgi:alkaline phosphatase D
MNGVSRNHLLTTLTLLVLPLASLTPLAAQEADYTLYKEIEGQHKIVGPLVGHVTDATAEIWAYAGPRDGKIALEVAELDAAGGVNDENNLPPALRTRLEQMPDPAKHYETQFHVTGLKPNTKYAFSIRVPGERAVEPGSFKTAPAAGAPAKFRLAVASCFGNTYSRKDGHTRAEHEYINHTWHLLTNREPDLQLIIGDNVYANSTDYNHLWDSHTLERVNNRPFSTAIRSIPTYAVWDDHDYGPNDSDGTAKGKEQSLRAFNEVFANPPRQGDDHTPGVFTSFSWGGVDFFLLDGRYHRSPDDAPDDDQKTMLGEAQFKWLIEQLQHSKAPFKVLVSGSSWAASQGDGWRVYRAARDQLWKAIVKHHIDGVVYVSGDIHRCDLPLHNPEVRGAYRMPEIISSGLGSHGKHDPLAFVYVDFDMTRDDPTFTAHVIDGRDRETVTRMVAASDLKLAGGEDE